MVAVAVQVAEQGVVGLQAFPEAQSRVEDDVVMTVSLQLVALLFEEVHHGLVDVAAEAVLVHGLRGAYAVHEHVGDTLLANVGQHVGVEESTRDVVDDVCTLVHGLFGDAFAEGVYGDDRLREFLTDGFQGRNEPFLFLLFGGDGVVGTGGASADVDDVCALFQQFSAVPDSVVNSIVFASVGKRVRRDVKDAHDGRVGEFHDVDV